MKITKTSQSYTIHMIYARIFKRLIHFISFVFLVLQVTQFAYAKTYGYYIDEELKRTDYIGEVKITNVLKLETNKINCAYKIEFEVIQSLRGKIEQKIFWSSYQLKTNDVVIVMLGDSGFELQKRIDRLNELKTASHEKKKLYKACKTIIPDYALIAGNAGVFDVKNKDGLKYIAPRGIYLVQNYHADEDDNCNFKIYHWVPYYCLNSLVKDYPKTNRIVL